MMALGPDRAVRRQIVAEACLHGAARGEMQREVMLPARLAMAPHYMALRRCLTQLGGFLLLNRGPRFNRRSAVAASLEVAAGEWREATDGFRAFRPPAQLVTVHAACLEAAELIGAAIGLMRRSFAPRGGGIAAADRALPLLERAQRALLMASDDRAGMAMVSFDCACCATLRA